VSTDAARGALRARLRFRMNDVRIAAAAAVCFFGPEARPGEPDHVHEVRGSLDA
jgi:hypothetical protein